MSGPGGYAIVDVDEDVSSNPSGAGSPRRGYQLIPQPAGDISRQPNNNLEFKTYLDTNPADGRSHQASEPRAAPDVPYSPFNIAYYQSYFDIDTNTVLKRVGMSMIPRDSFIAEICEGQIDLYGPFWTLTTLILTLYTTSTLTSSITQYLSPSSSEHITSNIPLLSTATSVIYFYGLAVPCLLWGVTRWLGIGDWGIAEVVGVYGYAMAVFVPISLACLIPVGIVRWVLVGLGAGSSGFFLFKIIYPVLVQSDNPMSRIIILAVLGLHAAMAFGMKVLFFSYSVAGVNAGPDPIDSPISS